MKLYALIDFALLIGDMFGALSIPTNTVISNTNGFFPLATTIETSSPRLERMVAICMSFTDSAYRECY